MKIDGVIIKVLDVTEGPGEERELIIRYKKEREIMFIDNGKEYK